jgi:hypothetical protein
MLFAAGLSQEFVDDYRLLSGNAEVLSEENIFEIDNIRGGIFKHIRRVVILNENGKEYGEEVLLENEFIKIKKFKGTIFDVQGKKIKKAGDDDFIETTISQDATLYDDAKYRILELSWTEFPYIVEIEYQLKFESLFFWPDWRPQSDIPVRKSSYTLILNEPVQFETYPIGISIEPEIEGNSYTWELTNISPLYVESWMPPENKTQKALLFAASRFEYGDFVGSNKSWKSFKAWYMKMIGNCFTLPAEERRAIKNLITGVNSEREKLSRLYMHLQQNTRYVSIALGTGGHKPQTARSVCLNRYGDCKDLSVLMVAMAREVGIEAYPVLIKTRDEGIVYDDFPGNQFNHAIVLAFAEGDSVWIECTANNLPLGELPPNDEGCKVLILKPDVETLVKTPVSNAESNKIVSSLSADLLADGTLLYEGIIDYTGNCSLNRRHNLLGESLEKQMEWLSSNVLGKFVPHIRLDNCAFENVEENFEKPLSARFNGQMNKFGVRSSKRLFFNPNYLHRQTPDDLPDEQERKFPLNYYYPFTTVDTIRINIPSGYELEAAPDQQFLESSFGQYLMRYSIENQQLEYIRLLRIEKKLITPESYNEYQSFMKQAVKTDNSKFVLKYTF